ncbi:MAG: PEGA domain-containing protein [bacterium]
MKTKHSFLKRLAAAFLALVVTAGWGASAGYCQASSDKQNDHLVVNSNPAGAVVTLEGEYKVTGRTPFTVTFPLVGKYHIRAAKQGYESWSTKVFLTGNSESNLSISLKRLSRAKSALRSFFVPGWGQFYSDRKFHAFLFASMGVAAGAYSIFRQIDYKDEIDKFNRLKDQVSQSTVSLQDLNKQFDKIEDADSERKKAFVILGAVWFYNFLDALIFFPSHEGQLNVSSNKRFQISQNVSKDAVELGVKVQF